MKIYQKNPQDSARFDIVDLWGFEENNLIS